jgi:hypothetical protein
MLQDLTPSSFEEHLGTRFRIHSEGEAPLEAELFQVARHEEHGGPRKQPFSILLRIPREIRTILPQSIYRVEHDQLGTMEIFLVPVGPDESGMRYEAVFN